MVDRYESQAQGIEFQILYCRSVLLFMGGLVTGSWTVLVRRKKQEGQD